MEWEEIAELRRQEIARLHRCCREYDREASLLREKLTAFESQETQPSEDAPKHFSVKGCVERIVDGECWIERPAHDEEAEFWGVYIVGPDGLDSHIADFNDKSDAEFFARCKESVYA